MRYLLDFGIGFLVLGFTEAVVKPIATKFVKRKILTYGPVVYSMLDKQMPHLLTKLNGEQLEQFVKEKLEELTGSEWKKSELEEFFKSYDPRITASQTPDE